MNVAFTCAPVGLYNCLSGVFRDSVFRDSVVTDYR